MKIALIKGTAVNNVIVGNELFLKDADPSWLVQFTEIHMLADDARVASGFSLNTPLGAGTHDLREETAEELARVYVEPPLPAALELVANEVVPAADPEAETDPEIELEVALEDDLGSASEVPQAKKRKSKKRK